jgi:hypothetical protein
MNDKNEIHISQDTPDDGEEDDEYNSDGEEVCLYARNTSIDT